MSRTLDFTDPRPTVLRAVVRGHVQGVGFRATTLEVARRLGLAGWVRNLSDGAVELEASGSRADLDHLVAFLQQGPRGAHVTSVAVDWGQPGEGLAADGSLPRPFEVRRTV